MASELVMSEGPCPVERRTCISTLEMGYAAFARAVIDLNISHVRPDVRWGGQSATTVALPRRCLSAPYITEIYTYMFAFACAFDCVCVSARAQSSSIEHAQ